MSGGLLRLMAGGAVAWAMAWPVFAWAQASAPVVAPATSGAPPATTTDVPPSQADAGGKAGPRACSDATDPGDGKGVPLDEIAQTPQTRIAAEWSYLPDRGTVHLLVLRPFDGKLSWRVFVDGSDVHQIVHSNDVSAQEPTTGDNGTDFLYAQTKAGKTLLEYHSDLASSSWLHGWTSAAQVVVVGCSLDKHQPVVRGSFDTNVSYTTISATTTVLLCVFFYIFAAMTTFWVRRKQRVVPDSAITQDKGITAFRLKRPPLTAVWGSHPLSGTNYASFIQHLDPVVLTAGSNGKGSATKLQILLFSLSVFGVMSYLLLMTGRLSGLSENVLLLMGISGIGAAAAAGTEVAKNRLDFDNWAWLVQNRWLPQGGVAEENMAEWKDIFSTDGEFDVYRFQMVTFSFMVAISLVGFAVRMDDLSHFQLSGQLLGILGLSQGVYIAGKLVAPPAMSDLDAQVGKLQEAEKALRAKADAAGLTGVQVVFAQTAPVRDVMTEYGAYLKLWQTTRTMFESTMGRDVPLEAQRLRPPFELTPLDEMQVALVPDATVGQPYFLPLKAFGGTQPYAWAVSSGALPAGISLTNGALTGSPTQAARADAAGNNLPSRLHRFQLTATDQAQVTKTRWFSILVR